MDKKTENKGWLLQAAILFIHQRIYSILRIYPTESRKQRMDGRSPLPGRRKKFSSIEGKPSSIKNERMKPSASTCILAIVDRFGLKKGGDVDELYN
ncbi:hypothetical protein ABE28_013915 [Peribacillus muralis]|uniref:Uncharacterized protein n=1 Tax=Peribacillus muralis TaxID=264697 RepID=A0A1B3XQG1_9BACI|nr:hypothetical protein ABE28_013915 [Peribacillus muralis]